MPGADPGEGYYHTNIQLFGKESISPLNTISNSGFIRDFAVAMLQEVGNYA